MSEHKEGSIEAPTRYPVAWEKDDFSDPKALFKELKRVFGSLKSSFSHATGYLVGASMLPSLCSLISNPKKMGVVKYAPPSFNFPIY
jgi:hypothetical protein